LPVPNSNTQEAFVRTAGAEINVKTANGFVGKSNLFLL
jgi:hypothetical protein